MPAVTVLAVLIGILWNNFHMNARFGDLRSEWKGRFDQIEGRFGEVDGRFAEMSRRIDDLRDLLRAEMAQSHSE